MTRRVDCGDVEEPGLAEEDLGGVFGVGGAAAGGDGSGGRGCCGLGGDGPEARKDRLVVAFVVLVVAFFFSPSSSSSSCSRRLSGGGSSLRRPRGLPRVGGGPGGRGDRRDAPLKRPHLPHSFPDVARPREYLEDVGRPDAPRLRDG